MDRVEVPWDCLELPSPAGAQDAVRRRGLDGDEPGAGGAESLPEMATYGGGKTADPGVDEDVGGRNSAKLVDELPREDGVTLRGACACYG